MTSSSVRVLVVDDSALYRKILRSALQGIAGVEVMGAAPNGRFALERIVADCPDLITLDLEMPELDGLGLLRALRERGLKPAVIVVSSQTNAGAKATGEALQLGAFDFIVKPTTNNLEESQKQLAADLSQRIDAHRQARRVKQFADKAPTPAPPMRFDVDRAAPITSPDILGIGVSTGGPVALHKLLPMFPADFPLPIVLVQHMPPIFTKTLADDLNRSCTLEVVEGTDGMRVMPGRIIIAPGGRQMRVARIAGTAFVQLTNDPPERNCRPAVDYLFRSLARLYGPRAWGAILTGMGDDGTRGALAMKEQGSFILAQDEASCVVYGMPRAVAEAGAVDFVGSLSAISQRIQDAVRQGAHA